MSKLIVLESVEIELGKVRKVASRAEDPLILYLIDMTILAVKRKALSECGRSEEPRVSRVRSAPQMA